MLLPECKFYYSCHWLCRAPPTFSGDKLPSHFLLKFTWKQCQFCVSITQRTVAVSTPFHQQAWRGGHHCVCGLWWQQRPGRCSATGPVQGTTKHGGQGYGGENETGYENMQCYRSYRVALDDTMLQMQTPVSVGEDILGTCA